MKLDIINQIANQKNSAENLVDAQISSWIRAAITDDKRQNLRVEEVYKQLNDLKDEKSKNSRIEYIKEFAKPEFDDEKAFHFEIARFDTSHRLFFEDDFENLKEWAAKFKPKSSVTKHFVICEIYNSFSSKYRIYYWEENKLIKDVSLESEPELTKKLDEYQTSSTYFHYKGIPAHFKSDPIKNLILKKFELHRYVDLLIACCSVPNNHNILEYIFSNNPKILTCQSEIYHCLNLTIKNQCLSNFLVLFNYCNKFIEKLVQNDFTELDIFTLFNKEKSDFSDSAPIIDIVFLLDQEKLLRLDNNFSYDTFFIETLGSTYENLLMRRNGIAPSLVANFLQLRIHPDEVYEKLSKYVFVLSNNSFITENDFHIYFLPYLKRYLDLSTIKSIKFFSNYFINSPEHSRDYSNFNIHEVYPLISVENSLLWDANHRKLDNPFSGIYEVVLKKLTQILDSIFFTVNSNIIIEYVFPSIFDLMNRKIKLWRNLAADLRDQKQALTSFPAIQQKPDSSDCGYWALFNTFKFLSETPFSSPGYFKWTKSTDEVKTYNTQFDKFKAWINQTVKPQHEDVTAIDMVKTFEQILLKTKNNLEFLKLFPELPRKVALFHETSGIPPYTIINSMLATGDEKQLDKTFCFGGNLPSLKMQVAINFYSLAQSINERRLHCILIGTQGHWHVQLLATSYGRNKGSINFFRLDSAPTSVHAIRQINAHLIDLLSNPLAYAEKVADELISPIFGKLLVLSKTTTHGLGYNQREQEIQQYCELLIQFFQAFNKLDIVKPYLPALNKAKELAFSLKTDFPEFEILSQKLTELDRTTALELYSQHSTVLTGACS